jgi:N-acetylglucosaminyldiphosphoundecaprenol N-acetyl-beta-D-mannosaminyltransferase
MGVVTLFGIPVQSSTMDEVLDDVDSAIADRRSLDIGVINAAKVVNMRRNPELAAAVLESDAIYADGMSVVWASRILGQSLPERIAGIDLMHGIMQRGRGKGYRVFCLGATQEVLDTVCKRFAEDYPGAHVVGAHNGYFTTDAEESIAMQIRDSNPDVLFVAITSPKKEQFMARWSDLMNVPVIHGVGGSFDVVAGKVERAPESWQKIGMEWLFRVLQEPRRMWKRYLVTNTLFLRLVLSEKLRLVRSR